MDSRPSRFDSGGGIVPIQPASLSTRHASTGVFLEPLWM